MYLVNETLIQTIIQCANACDHCTSSCLQEKHVAHLTVCIQRNMECASVCRATAQLLHFGSDHANAACQLCADICNACAEECEKHEHDHCQKCAAACRKCAEECVSLTAA